VSHIDQDDVSPDGKWVRKDNDWVLDESSKELEKVKIGKNIQNVGSHQFPDSNSLWRIDYTEHIENHGYFVSTRPEPKIQYEQIMFLLEKPDSKLALATFIKPEEILDQDLERTALKKGISKENILSELSSVDWTMIYHDKEWSFTQNGVSKKKQSRGTIVEKIATKLQELGLVSWNNIFG